MKTNVVMRSVDRVLLNVTVRQNTNKGEHLCINDLMVAYENGRTQYGWVEKNLTMIMGNKSFIERVYYILNERKSINLKFLSFMELVDNQGLLKTLKSMGFWRTTGRGDNKITYADPYIWMMLALELNPLIYAKVIIWLTDGLIFNRNVAGAEYLPMNDAVCSIIDDPKYFMYAIEINKKVFGYHQTGIRNYASEQQLDYIVQIERFVTQLILQGMISTEEELIKAIQNYRFRKPLVE